MANRQHFRVSHIKEALIKGAGIPSVAAKILAQAYGSCTPPTVRNYIKRYPKLQAVVANALDENLDLAESKLLVALNQGADWAVKFYLETQGKSRGYTKRSEIAGVPQQPIVVTNAREWLTEQLDNMEARLRQEPGRPHGAAGTDGTAETAQKTVH
jgi:hypothetical protein